MGIDKDVLGHIHEQEEEEARKSGKSAGARTRYDQFECPACTAYNPHDDFGNGDELTCSFCGLPFVALVDEEGKLRLKEA